MKNEPYRLGIDLGTNSLGWCLLKLDKEGRPSGIHRIGSRIFSDGREPQRGEPLARERRTVRGARRRRDRFLQRKNSLMNLLVTLGLMPKSIADRKKLETLDPYHLRSQAFERALNPHELGRALFHLNQRRGFLSNRKTASKDEAMVIGPKIEGLKKELAQSSCKTLGAFLHKRIQEGKIARSRPEEDLYPTRAMYQDEFEKIKNEQSKHHPQVSQKDWDKLQRRIFDQRDLRPQEPGRCQVYPEERRVPAALPSYQQFRIAQDITNLAYITAKGEKVFLDETQRKILWDLLQKQKTIKFSSIQTKLKLPENTQFNLESEKRKELKGNPTAIMLSGKDYFGPAWFKLPDATRDSIVLDLMNIEKEEGLIQKARQEWGTDLETAQRLSALTPNDFVKGYGRFGSTALKGLLPLMRDKGLQYHEAMQSIGAHHSDRRPTELLPRLEYYGKLLPEAVFIQGNPSADEKTPEKKYGRIGNPTVHIGLNQTFKVVNEIINTFGPPAEIVVELARDLKSNNKQKQDIIKEQSNNQKNNIRIGEELEKLGEQNNGLNRLKYKLWEELSKDLNDRRCPFSGEKITPVTLFKEGVEIEHILPLSQTLDDSQNNKTLSTRKANRLKRNRSPYDAFAGDDSLYDYADILERARHLPGRKFRRFLPEAMDVFRDENTFLARQLNDTRYLSKVAKQYLSHICPDNKIWVIPGILTAMLRHKLGLNSICGEQDKKDRNDHRHHAIDALVTGLTDRSLLKRVSDLSRAGLLESSEELDDIGKPRLKAPEPWSGFHKEVEEAIHHTIVSHKPDHGVEGKMHEDTAYGIIKNPSPWEKAQGFNVVRRKALSDLSRGELAAIRDPHLREKLQAFAESFESNKELKLALSEFAGTMGVKRIRVLKKENPIIHIQHPRTNPIHLKGFAPGPIHHIEFWKMPDGTLHAEGINYFEANQKNPILKRPHPASKLVLKIHKGDLMRLIHKGREKTARVVSLSPENKTVWLVEHFEGGNLAARYKEKKLDYIFLSFSKLKDARARKIHVDPLGGVKDPGAIL